MEAVDDDPRRLGGLSSIKLNELFDVDGDFDRCGIYSCVGVERCDDDDDDDRDLFFSFSLSDSSISNVLNDLLLSSLSFRFEDRIGSDE